MSIPAYVPPTLFPIPPPGLRKEGALLCATLCELATKATAGLDAGDCVCWEEAATLGKELEAVSWQSLHSGPAWREVGMATRRAYAQSQFILAAALISQGGQHAPPGWKECMRRLDMALLMGPPDIKNVGNDLIEWVVTIQQQQQPQPQEVQSPKQQASPSRKRPRAPSPIHDSCEHIPRIPAPPLHVFLDKYMKSQIPVILTGCMEHWPALEKWQDLDYFKRVAGGRTVPVEVGNGTYLSSSSSASTSIKNEKEDGSTEWGQQLMTMSDFIESFVLSDKKQKAAIMQGYLAQHELFDHIPVLRKDILVPDYCALEVDAQENEHEDDDGNVIVNAWFGPPGTISPTHTDPYHNLLAQVVGSKAIKLFAPSQSPFLYAHKGLMYNNSQVDPNAPDLERFPLFAQAQSQSCILETGEMLYIPPLWWHFIESLEVSFSVSFWWGRRRQGGQDSQEDESEEKAKESI